MIARTGFPEYVESMAIGPDADFLRTDTDMCDVVNDFPQEFDLAYKWKKIGTSDQPVYEARDFMKNFLIDAPDLSVEFIDYYVKKVDMLPPKVRDQIISEVEDAFVAVAGMEQKTAQQTTSAIESASTRQFDNNKAIHQDSDFLDKLADLMNSCRSSCNYFSPASDKVGSIFDFSRLNSINAATPGDSDLNAPPPMGIGLNIFNKVPAAIQDTLTRAYTSAKLLVDAAKTQLVDPGNLKQLRQFAQMGVAADKKSIPYVGSTGSSLFQDALGLNSNLMSKVRRNLGDCFRMTDFKNRYNAFDADMNLAQASERTFGLKLKDAALGGQERQWLGTAQGVAGGLGSEVYSNNITPAAALRSNTTGDARLYDDLQTASNACMRKSAADVASGATNAVTTFNGSSATGVQVPGSISVDAKGKVNQEEMHNYLVKRLENSPLNGTVPPDAAKYGVDGTPESWANFFGKLARAESSYNVNEVNPTDPGGGSYGVFQVSAKDGAQYKANPESRPWTMSELKDPTINAHTAVTIFEKQVLKTGTIATSSGKGAGGYFASASMRKIANSVR